jgi:CRISPR-associated protein Csx10
MADIWRAIRTRTSIHSPSGTAAAGMLYSRQVLQPGMRFWGSWSMEDAVTDEFEVLIEEAAAYGLIRVGTNRTRGFGLVQCQTTALEEDEEENSAALRQRVEIFTAQVKQAAAAAHIAANAAYYVPLLLTSDAILLDDVLRARLRLSAADLQAVGIVDAELVFHAASRRQVSSWSTLWGVPRADDWAIAMGSVFVFALPDADEQTFDALLHLQQQGVGVRRAEGFGRLAVAHPFHAELTGGTFE